MFILTDNCCLNQPVTNQPKSCQLSAVMLIKLLMFSFLFVFTQVVGDNIDACTNHINPKSYESIYSLLDSMSPGYVQRFGEKLAGKLAGLDN